MIYYLHTLVDITETKQRWGSDQLAKHQQKNFDIVCQTIGLYGNYNYSESPIIIKDRKLGKKSDVVWRFEWSMEHDDIFLEDHNPIKRLTHIFDLVPVITNLSETAKLDPMFIVGKNITFGYT